MKDWGSFRYLAALAIHIRKGIVVSIAYRKGYTYWSIDHLLNGERRGGGGGGDNLCGRGTISASGLRPWGTISASRLCPGGQNLRGDRICSDTSTKQIGYCRHLKTRNKASIVFLFTVLTSCYRFVAMLRYSS